MPVAALALSITAAFLHTGWNLLLKGVQEKGIFTWSFMVAGSLLYIPVLILGRPIPQAIWPYAIASAIFESLYLLALISAYQIDDFSLVYPMARGAAPALLAIWSTLFLGERISLPGVAGLGLILVGLLVIGGERWWSALFKNHSHEVSPGDSPRRLNRGGMALALATAVCISIYSVIDGGAVRHMDPTQYTVLALTLTTLLITPFVWFHFGPRRLLDGLRCDWKKALIVGIFVMLTYILVLRAYAIGPVSYAGAVRECSVVLAAFAGWLLLKEKFGLSRTAGAILVFAGILTLALIGRSS